VSELVTLHIDDQELSVTRGTTIIEAASQAGIEIPHLCYFEGLERTGACRMCLVEVEGAKELVVACTMRVREGMAVRTRTDKVLKARRFVLELIWSTHPGDCTTCEKSGACLLQKYTYESGADKNRFAPTRKYDESLVDRSNPLIELDHNLCILCGRCIRACQTQGNYVLDFVKRGMTMKVTTPFDRPLHKVGCGFCGSCISVCPVACLTERDRKFRGREWEFRPVETVCPYCGCGCDVLLDTIDGQIVRARNSQRNGYLCARGRFGWDYVLSQERLQRPLIKKSGSFTECTWDEALAYVSERLAQVKETHGPHALGGLISAHYPNEVLYLFQKFTRAGLGTNNVDSSARLYSLPTAIGFLRAFHGPGVASPLSAIDEADVLLLVGPGIATRYPLLGVKVKQALSRGAQVIIIDPLSTWLARSPHLHLRPRPGSEAFLLRSIGTQMVKQGLYDEGFASACHNFEEFKASRNGCDEERAGVAAEQVLEAAKLYGDPSRRALIVFSADASDLSLVLEVGNLLLLTGRTKGGAVPCLIASNLQGATDLGAVAEFYPGYQAVSDPKARRRWEEAWEVSLPDQEGLSALEMIKAAGSSLRGMYILGENVARSFPGTASVEQALSALDFLVVQDLFLSETARLADVILPGTSFAESEGTLTGVGHELRRLRRAIEPQTKPDWQTICEISCHLGFPLRYGSEQEIREEMETLLPAWPALGGEVFGSESLCTRRGELSFHVERPGEVSEETDQEYPFLLMTGPTLFGHGDEAWTGRSRLSRLEPAGGYVSVSPEDAASLGVGDGLPVQVSSRNGSVAATIRVESSLPRGLVFIPAHSLSAQALTGSSLEPVTKAPRFRLWAIGISAL
jgi:formate dehydrogenase alpha subunit